MNDRGERRGHIERMFYRIGEAATIVGEEPHVLRDSADALKLPGARRDRALGELRHAVLHEALILGRLEVDHPWARLGLVGDEKNP